MLKYTCYFDHNQSVSRNRVRNICCIGAGYVGGPTMAVFADECSDINVTVVDINPEKISLWNSNDLSELPIFEPGLDKVILRCRDINLFFSTEVEANIANDNFKNPFSTAINLYGNTGGSVSGNTYSIPLRNADSMFIDNTDNELYVIIRYKGDPAPVTSINLSYS